MSQRPVTEVAVGVVFSADRRKILFGQRPAGKPYAGWWEFPGGKLEQGESVRDALVRELYEELGITATQIAPWAVVEHSYPHAYVRLHFCRVLAFSGAPTSREQQAFAWADADAVSLDPLLPATAPVLQWLQLPDRLGWNPGVGVESLRLTANERLGIVVDQPALTDSQLDTLMDRVFALKKQGQLDLIVGARHLPRYRQSVDGVHYTRAELQALAVRPEFRLVGASCLDAADLAQAARLNLSYVQLPYQNDAAAFTCLAQNARQPVYAAVGEHGIADASLIASVIAAGAQGVSGYFL